MLGMCTRSLFTFRRSSVGDGSLARAARVVVGAPIVVGVVVRAIAVGVVVATGCIIEKIMGIN
jgi:hypothetical protein